MLKTVLSKLMDECRMEMNKLKKEEINEETVSTFIFLNKQLNYMREIQNKIIEEEKSKNE